MQPIGGLSLVIHFVIIIVARIKKSLGRFLRLGREIVLPRPIPILIVIFVFAIVSLGTINIFSSSMDKNYSPDSPPFAFDIYTLTGKYILPEIYGQEKRAPQEVCIPIEVRLSRRNVVLRIDDVQAYAWNNISSKMINESLSRKIPVVAGVIPFRIEQDAFISNYLRKNSCNIEIAQHGWSDSSYTHNATGIESLPDEKLLSGLIEGKARLENLSGGPVKTFIPPNNIEGPKIIHAIYRAGFSRVSSEGNTFYDYSVSGFDSSENNLTNISKILNSCEKVFSENKPCVIMLHPQDYMAGGTLDLGKYKSFLNMLDELEKRNVTFARFSDMPSLQI
jgi:hypothetical protein